MKQEKKAKDIVVPDFAYNLQLLRECFHEDIFVTLAITKRKIRVLKAESTTSQQLEQVETEGGESIGKVLPIHKGKLPPEYIS